MFALQTRYICLTQIRYNFLQKLRYDINPENSYREAIYRAARHIEFEKHIENLKDLYRWRVSFRTLAKCQLFFLKCCNLFFRWERFFYFFCKKDRTFLSVEWVILNVYAARNSCPVTIFDFVVVFRENA